MLYTVSGSKSNKNVFKTTYHTAYYIILLLGMLMGSTIIYVYVPVMLKYFLECGLFWPAHAVIHATISQGSQICN